MTYRGKLPIGNVVAHGHLWCVTRCPPGA